MPGTYFEVPGEWSALEIELPAYKSKIRTDNLYQLKQSDKYFLFGFNVRFASCVVVLSQFNNQLISV